MCGARGVAACDGRQALHVRAEQLGEGAGLGLAQLRELGGHVGDRAVVLAELDAPGARPGADLADLGGVPRAASTPASAATRSCGAPAARTCAAAGPRRSVDALGGEPVDAPSPPRARRGSAARRRRGRRTPCPNRGPACVGEQVVPRRAPPTARAARGASRTRPLRPRSARRGGGGPPAPDSSSSAATGRRGARPLLHEQPGDGGAGAALRMPRLGPGTRVHDGLRTPADGGRVHDGNRIGVLFTTPVLPISPRDRQSRPPCQRGRVSGLTVGPGRYPADMSRAGLGTPPPATPAPPVDVPEAGLPTMRDPARIPRRLGLTGALMMGIGALGAAPCPCRTRCSGCG